MYRLGAWFVLILALLQGTGAAAAFAQPACETEHHGGSQESGDCAPDCATCPCCVHVAAIPLSAAGRLEPCPPTLGAELESPGFARLAPPSGDIFHVPLARR